MAKQTKAQAKRALKAIETKAFKLYECGHITATHFLKLTDLTEKCLKRLK
jgi:hypothetical protein